MYSLFQLVYTGPFVLLYLERYCLSDTGLNVLSNSTTEEERPGDISFDQHTLDIKFDISRNREDRSISQNTLEGENLGQSEFLNCTQRRTCSGQCHKMVSDDHYCHCDSLCRFYGDCCVDYYSSCLKLDMNETDKSIVLAILSTLENYQQVIEFGEVVKLTQMSSCYQIVGKNYGIQLVGKCSTDVETQRKFDTLCQRLEKSSQSDNFVPEIRKEEIVSKCEHSRKLQSATPGLETTPATWNATHTVQFYNVFCALCNGIHPENVTLWESSISSNELRNMTESSSEFSPHKFAHQPSAEQCRTMFRTSSKLRKCYSIHDKVTFDLTDKMVELNNKVTSDVIDNLTNTNETNIYNEQNNNLKHKVFGKVSKELQDSTKLHVETFSNECVDKGSGQSEPKEEMDEVCSSTLKARLCALYSYPFFYSNKQYKNPHCMPCPDNITFQNETFHFWQAYKCPYSICQCETRFNTNMAKSFLPMPSFRILFDFRSHSTKDENINVHFKTCPTNQTFVPVFQQCKDTVCLPGWHLVNQACVLDARGGHEENFTDRPMSVKTIKEITTLTVTIRLRYILGIEHRSEETNAGRFVRRSINEADMNNVTRSSFRPLKHPVSKHQRTNLSDLIETKTLRSLWAQVLDDLQILSAVDAFKKLTMELHGHMTKVFNQSIHVQSDLPSETASDVKQLSFHLDLNNTASTDMFLTRMTKPDIMLILKTTAHINNFILEQISLTSSPANTPFKLKPSESLFSKTQGAQLCSNHEKFALQKVNVSMHENGSYYVRFQGLPIPLTEILFRSQFKLDQVDEGISLSSAEIGVCELDDNCSYLYFNRSEFILYENNLVLTSHQQNLTHFLNRLSRAKEAEVSLSDLLDMLRKDFGQTQVYTSSSYLLRDDGAYVCQDYNSSYTFTNVTFTKSFRFLETSFTEQIATTISLALSILCLIVVLLVYSLVPELRNTPGKIVMSLSSALLLAQTLFLFSMLPSGLTCQIYAAVQHAMWLSSFAWLAVMACHLAYVLYFQAHASSGTTFNIFTSLCWLLPLMLASCCFALDKTGKVSIEYGLNGICWIGNVKAMIYTFGIPIFTLLSSTLISAVFVLRAIRKSSEFRHRNTQNHTGERMQLILCVNLSLLMGFNWVFYFLAFMTDTTSMWTVFIITNGSQGCFIFLCYVARKAVLSKLAKQLSFCHGSLKTSKYTQSSPNVSQVATKSTLVSRSPALSAKHLHLVVTSHASNSPTTSSAHFDQIITY
ncbi:latrophilin-3 [Biomphalaria glabrata]|nr:latrophilin-3 [Biomphalaria glabrata]